MTTRTDTPSTQTGTPMVHGGTPILADIRERFGGIDTPAAIVGALTAIGVITFLTALLAAGSASIAFQMDLIDTEGTFSDLDAVGFAVALAVVFVGFLVGGWAAGRMARYDGGKNGLAAAFWMLVLIVGFAAAGALIAEEYNAFAATDLPDWMSQIAADDVTTVGIVAAALAVVVMFLGGWIGGRLGETYHHRVDAAVAHAARQPEQLPSDRSRPEPITKTPVSTDRERDIDRDRLAVDDAGEERPVLTVPTDADVRDSGLADSDVTDADVVDAEVVAIPTQESRSGHDDGLATRVLDADGHDDHRTDHDDAAHDDHAERGDDADTLAASRVSPDTDEHDSDRFGVAPTSMPGAATGPGRGPDTTPT